MTLRTSTLLIPAAAFALIATNAAAFNGEVLKQAGLSDDQIAAIEVARELKRDGDREAAREVLEEAGIDHEILAQVRKTLHTHKHQTHEAIIEAIEGNDFTAFIAAATDTPLEVIVTEAEFQQLREAYGARAAGDPVTFRSIMETLGIEKPTRHHHGGHYQPGLF